jgi:hypothetical protein
MAAQTRHPEVLLAVYRHGLTLLAWWLVLTRMMCHFS